MKSQKQFNRVYSFEFFPPKTAEGADKLRQVRATLAQLKPRFFSVTFGAGGSTRDRTFQTVLEIQTETGILAAPHLSCVGSTRENIRDILLQYRNQGIKHLVALRGDLPSGTYEAGEFRYANELVSFIRQETGDHFHIEVAAYPEFHPQAQSASKDLLNFKRKVDAGANSAITQYFYSADSYFRFVESCERSGINIPIVPGIMPITNYQQLARFSDACGAEIPRWLRWRLEEFGENLEALREYGLDVVAKLCDQLLSAGAPGLHFYTMNQATSVVALWERLQLPR